MNIHVGDTKSHTVEMSEAVSLDKILNRDQVEELSPPNSDTPNAKKKKTKTGKKKSKKNADMNLCGVIGHLPTLPMPPQNDVPSVTSSPISSKSSGINESAAKRESPVISAVKQPKCNKCDPTSSVEHKIMTTRIRVANLCCAGEEAIIMSTLNPFNGVESIKTNVIGRYAIVKHCPEECCSPSERMVEKLCEARLGASIQEAGDETDEEQVTGPPLWKMAHAAIVTAIFIAAILIDIHYDDEKDAFWIYLCNVVIGAVPILKKAFEAILFQRTVNIQVLMIVAIAGAMGAKEFHDAGIVVTLFIIAELLEEYVMSVVRRAVSNSARGLVKTATLVETGKQVPIDSLKVGERIAVRAGDMIPVDGDVVGGQGVVDESALTGEATPVAKSMGSKVISGTVVQNGYVEISVSVEPENSTLRRMNQAVDDVQADRGKFAAVVDQFAVYWTPLILIIGLFFLVIGGSLTGDWEVYLERTLVILVLSCPCAVVLAAPIACVCGIAGAARHGVLIKGSSIIEKLGLIDVVSVDKTGTLTKGFFSLLDSVSLVTPDVLQERKLEGIPAYNALQLAAALESKSAHPLANAIVAGFCGCIADMDPNALPNVEDVTVLDGVGLEGIATLDDGELVRVSVGNERLFEVNGGPCKMTDQQAAVLDSFTEKYKAATIVIVSVEDRLELVLALGGDNYSIKFKISLILIFSSF